MAIKNLFHELEDLMDFLFPVTEYYPEDYKDISLQGKKMPKSGSTDPLRKLMGRETHHFSISVTQTVEDMSEASYRKVSKGQKFKLLSQSGPGKASDLATLKEFAVELIGVFNTNIGSVDDSARNGVFINTSRGGYSAGKEINITVCRGHTFGGRSDPYEWLSQHRTKWGNELINSKKKYKNLFFKGRTKSFGEIEDIGHQVGVVHGKSSAALSRLDSVTARIQRNVEGHEIEMGQNTTGTGGPPQAVEGGTFLEDDLKILQDTRAKAQQAFTQMGINFKHYKKISVQNGELQDVLQIECDLEGETRNEIQQANSTLGLGLSEKEIGLAIKDTLNNLIADLRVYYAKELGADAVTHRSTSPSFMLTMRNMLIANPAISRLRKLGRVRSTIKKFEQPKNIRPRSTPTKYIRFHSKSVDHGTVSGHPAIKSEKTQTKGAPRPSSGRNLSTLPALINAKLGDTVIGNMGAPALENVTGTFAASAKVLAATPGPGGPNLSYSYNKDPYEVFEMGGRGRVPWATAGRDPRNIIDKSIREIAAEMALGKLTTRRV